MKAWEIDVAAVNKPYCKFYAKHLYLHGCDFLAPFSVFIPPLGRLAPKGQGRPIQSSAAEITVMKEAGE